MEEQLDDLEPRTDADGRAGRQATAELKAQREVEFWYRLGLALADVEPPERYAYAYSLGRKTAALRRR
jgi:hypothetical protein